MEELCRCTNSFAQLFALERKQIAFMADEKSPVRISHRLFATGRSEMECNMTKEEINQFSMRISQSNRTQIVVITYEIIINYLDSARKSIDNSNVTDFVRDVRKARQFVNELSSVLDFRYKISFELMNLYMFANECLLKSELRREDVNIEAVRDMMVKLRDSFETVSKQDNSKPVMQAREKVYEGLTYGKNGMGTVMVSK